MKNTIKIFLYFPNTLSRRCCISAFQHFSPTPRILPVIHTIPSFWCVYVICCAIDELLLYSHLCLSSPVLPHSLYFRPCYSFPSLSCFLSISLPISLHLLLSHFSISYLNKWKISFPHSTALNFYKCSFWCIPLLPLRISPIGRFKVL